MRAFTGAAAPASVRTGAGLTAVALFTGLFAIPNSASGAFLTNVNITGQSSWETLGNAVNDVLIVNLGAGAVITGIGWNVTQTANTPSWLSDMAIQFSDSSLGQAFSLRPGITDNFPGTASYSSGGVLTFSSLSLPNMTLANGQLRLEFYEIFDDFPAVVDGTWTGTVFRGESESILTIEYIPAPSGLAAFALAGAALSRRRRG